MKGAEVKPNGKTENWKYLFDPSLKTQEKPRYFCKSICMST